MKAGKAARERRIKTPESLRAAMDELVKLSEEMGGYDL